MATDVSKAKPQFFLYAPFKRDSTFDERRKIAFPEHAARVTQMKKDGIVKVGVPVITVASIGKAKEDIESVASVVIIEAESYEKVKELVEADAFYKHGVWDIDNINLLPCLLSDGAVYSLYL